MLNQRLPATAPKLVRCVHMMSVEVFVYRCVSLSYDVYYRVRAVPAMYFPCIFFVYVIVLSFVFVLTDIWAKLENKTFQWFLVSSS